MLLQETARLFSIGHEEIHPLVFSSLPLFTVIPLFHTVTLYDFNLIQINEVVFTCSELKVDHFAYWKPKTWRAFPLPL